MNLHTNAQLTLHGRERIMRSKRADAAADRHSRRPPPVQCANGLASSNGMAAPGCSTGSAPPADTAAGYRTNRGASAPATEGQGDRGPEHAAMNAITRANSSVSTSKRSTKLVRWDIAYWSKDRCEQQPLNTNGFNTAFY